ncbi:hypothetical protein SO180_21050 [Bradyrhizobium sp. UFLA05-112]
MDRVFLAPERIQSLDIVKQLNLLSDLDKGKAGGIRDSVVVFVPKNRQQLGGARQASARHNSQSSMWTRRADSRATLPHQHFTPSQIVPVACRSTEITGTNRIVSRVPASQIGSAFAASDLFGRDHRQSRADHCLADIMAGFSCGAGALRANSADSSTLLPFRWKGLPDFGGGRLIGASWGAIRYITVGLTPEAADTVLGLVRGQCTGKSRKC